MTERRPVDANTLSSRDQISSPVDVRKVMQDAMAEQAYMARTGQQEITIKHDPSQLAAMKEAATAVSELIERDRVMRDALQQIHRTLSQAAGDKVEAWAALCVAAQLEAHRALARI